MAVFVAHNLSYHGNRDVEFQVFVISALGVFVYLLSKVVFLNGGRSRTGFPTRSMDDGSLSIVY